MVCVRCCDFQNFVMENIEMITRENKSKFCNMFLKYRDFFLISIFKSVLKLNEQTKRNIKYITKIHIISVHEICEVLIRMIVIFILNSVLSQILKNVPKRQFA